jgi:peptidoglycan/xylan/chitin deacetylase (PgdA/CDA1 family)
MTSLLFRPPLVAASTALLGVALGTAAVGLAHAAPTLAAIGPMRRRLLPRLSGHADSDHIALTFNDGPDPQSTPAFMRLLADRDVRATFFLLGNMLTRAPGIGAELVAAGHEVALHGYTHRCLLWQGPRSVADDLARGRDLITDLTGQAPIWYRPPYGILTTSGLHAAHRLGLTTRLWTCSGRDTAAHATLAKVYDAVVRDLAQGGTILLHDSDCSSYPGTWRTTLAALPPLLDLIQAAGMRVGPLRHHHAPPG